MTTLPEVTIALPSDEDEIMEMCRLLGAENSLAGMDEKCVRSVLRTAFERRGGVLAVIRNDKQIEAMLFMLLAQIWYTNEWHLEELFNYVRLEYRKSNNAKAMMQYAKKCADELALPLLVGVISNTRTEEKVRLYERQFGKRHGAFFTYNSKWQDEPQAA